MQPTSTDDSTKGSWLACFAIQPRGNDLTGSPVNAQLYLPGTINSSVYRRKKVPHFAVAPANLAFVRKNGMEQMAQDFRGKQATCKCQKLHPAQENNPDAVCMYISYKRESTARHTAPQKNEDRMKSKNWKKNFWEKIFPSPPICVFPSCLELLRPLKKYVQKSWNICDSVSLLHSLSRNHIATD